MSFVRSITLDSLSLREQRALAVGGNEAFNAFLADPARGVSRKVWLALPLLTRYHTPAADLYRRRLEATLASEEAASGTLPVELDTAIRPPPPPPAPDKPLKPRWTADRDALRCELCKVDFNLLNWRHHCRLCGRCVCANCSPAESWRPLPGLAGEPARHCKLCVTPTRPMIGMGS